MLREHMAESSNRPPYEWPIRWSRDSLLAVSRSFTSAEPPADPTTPARSFILYTVNARTISRGSKWMIEEMRPATAGPTAHSWSSSATPKLSGPDGPAPASVNPALITDDQVAITSSTLGGE